MSKGLLLDYLPDENIKAPIPEGKIWLYANTDSGEPQIKGKLATGKEIVFGPIINNHTIRTVYYQCVSVDTASKTWSGRKWLLTIGVYSLSDVVTEGLPIAGLTPIVGNSYSQDTLLRVDKFWQQFPIPEDGLMLYIPMNSVATTAETGQPLAMSGTLSTEVVSGIPCTYFNGSSWYTVEGGAINPSDYSGDFTESMWVKIHPDASGKLYMALTTADYNGDHYYFNIGLNFYDNGFFTGGTDNTPTTDHIEGAVVDTTKWHHVVYVHDSTSERMYVDGVFYGSCSYYRRPEWGWERYYGARTWDGFDRSNWNGWIAGVRSYNRALTEDEITALAREFEPTE